MNFAFTPNSPDNRKFSKAPLFNFPPFQKSPALSINSNDNPSQMINELQKEKVNTSVLNESHNSINNRFSTDFDTLGCIGTGHYGKVYKCRNKLDGVNYAVKITNDSIKSTQIKFALNEVVALASVGVLKDNNYIVRYHNCFLENSKLHLVMELCQSNLKSKIPNQKTLTEK